MSGAGVALREGAWWKLLNGILALVFIATGIVAFVHSGDTFAALAAVMSFFVLLPHLRRDIRHHGVHFRPPRDRGLGAGVDGSISGLVVGFWAAGYYGRSAVLLIAWVAAIALIRGVRDRVLAVRVREVQHA